MHRFEFFWQCLINISILHDASSGILGSEHFNSYPNGQNVRHFADNIFKYIFINEKFCILIRISLKCVPKSPIHNKSALVQVMAWHRTGDKPLPESMLTQFIESYMLH